MQVSNAFKRLFGGKHKRLSGGNPKQLQYAADQHLLFLVTRVNLARKRARQGGVLTLMCYTGSTHLGQRNFVCDL